MNIEKIKQTIQKILEDMNCTDILFQESKDDLIVATFNCKEITSFVTVIPGWKYSGIQLDSSGERQYKIVFRKIV